MDWHIKTIARKSCLTDKFFVPGDKVVSLIYVEDKAEKLGRGDLLSTEVNEFIVNGDLLGRWTCVIKEMELQTDDSYQRVASAEELFLSLYNDHSGEGQQVHLESSALKHLLALMLERKRVLRAIGPRVKHGDQLYYYSKNKQDYHVPIVDISADLMLRIQDVLSDIVL